MKNLKKISLVVLLSLVGAQAVAMIQSNETADVFTDTKLNTAQEHVNTWTKKTTAWKWGMRGLLGASVVMYAICGYNWFRKAQPVLVRVPGFVAIGGCVLGIIASIVYKNYDHKRTHYATELNAREAYKQINEELTKGNKQLTVDNQLEQANKMLGSVGTNMSLKATKPGLELLIKMLKEKQEQINKVNQVLANEQQST